jgi:predicted transposase YdaD
VDSNLAQVIGDIRYSTVFKRTQQKSNVFVFLEHQSTSDDLICLRVLEYIVKSYWEYIDNAKQEPKSLPCPIVVILYHGKKPWGTLKRMRDLIDSVPGFPKDLLDFPVFLIDLSQIPKEQLKGHPALVALLETLQLGSEGKLEAGFDRVTGRLTAVRNDPRAAGWMTALVRYSLSICRIGQEAVVKAFTKILSQKEAEKMAMSTAQELRLEGKVEGKVEGKKETILDVLKGRFGKVPKTISDTVNSYSDLTALKSLAVFAGSCESLDEFKEGLR